MARSRVCQWGVCRNPADALVVTVRSCGHGRSDGVPTCPECLRALHAAGGSATAASTCRECGAEGLARVASVTDL